MRLADYDHDDVDDSDGFFSVSLTLGDITAKRNLARGGLGKLMG